MTTLLMFSGGIDSTAGLIHLLTETDDKLHVHHVIIKENTREGLSIAQLESVNEIIPYCKKRYRDFKFTTSCLDFRDIQKDHMSNYIGVSFIVLVLLHQDLDIKRVIPIVLNKEDVDRNHIHFFWGHGPPEDIGTRLEKVEKLATIDVDRKIIFDYLFTQTPRLIMVKKYLSKNLFDMTWACNYPISSNISWNDRKDKHPFQVAYLYDDSFPPIECGRCGSCIEKARIEDNAWVEE